MSNWGTTRAVFTGPEAALDALVKFLDGIGGEKFQAFDLLAISNAVGDGGKHGYQTLAERKRVAPDRLEVSVSQNYDLDALGYCASVATAYPALNITAVFQAEALWQAGEETVVHWQNGHELVALALAPAYQFTVPVDERSNVGFGLYLIPAANSDDFRRAYDAMKVVFSAGYGLPEVEKHLAADAAGWRHGELFCGILDRFAIRGDDVIVYGAETIERLIGFEWATGLFQRSEKLTSDELMAAFPDLHIVLPVVSLEGSVISGGDSAPLLVVDDSELPF